MFFIFFIFFYLKQNTVIKGVGLIVLISWGLFGEYTVYIIYCEGVPYARRSNDWSFNTYAHLPFQYVGISNGIILC